MCLGVFCAVRELRLVGKGPSGVIYDCNLTVDTAEESCRWTAAVTLRLQPSTSGASALNLLYCAAAL